VLFNSTLSSLPIFIMSYFEIPKVSLKDCILSVNFFWQGNNDKKYYLAKWDILRHPKGQGGMWITYLWIKNKCLLSKWSFKLFNEGTWQTFLMNKYLIIHYLSSNWTRASIVSERFTKCFEDLFRLSIIQNKWWFTNQILGAHITLKDQFCSLYNIANCPM